MQAVQQIFDDGAAGSIDQCVEPSFEINFPARICVPDGGDSICCSLIEIGKEGARLTTQSPHRVPDSFVLKSRAAKLDLKATVAWRQGVEMGVRFDAR